MVLALSGAISDMSLGQETPRRTAGDQRIERLGGVVISVNPLTGETRGRFVPRGGRAAPVPRRVGPVVNQFFTVDFPSGGFRCADCGYSCSPGDTRTIESNFLMTDGVSPGAEITALSLGNVSLGGSAASQVSQLFDPEPFCDGEPARWDHVVTLDGCTVFSMYYDLFGVVVDEGLDRLYWSDLLSDELLRLPTDAAPGDPPEQVLASFNPLGIALDQSVGAGDGKIYWAVQVLPPPNPGQTIDGILRANLDGTEVEVVVDGLGSPIGIALDLVARKVYWADHGFGTISRANLDGSDVEDVLTGLNDPIDLALDVAAGLVYWTDHDGRRIRRARMADGSGQIQIATGGGAPQGIALDLARGKVYWTETTGDKIQRANLDLTGMEVVVEGNGFIDLVGISVDVPDDALLFGDHNARKLQRYELSTGVLTDLLTNLAGPWDVDLERAPCGGSLPLTAGTWQAFSLPCQLPGAGRVVEVLEGVDGEYSRDLWVAEYDARTGRYVELGLGDRLEAGRGYWVRTEREGQALEIRGVQADPEQLYEVPLEGGPEGVWNPVGNPFDFEVDWSRVRVRSGGRVTGLDGADPVIHGVRACEGSTPHPECVVSRVGQRESGGGLVLFDDRTAGADRWLRPFETVWVQAYQDATLLIPALPAAPVDVPAEDR